MILSRTAETGLFVALLVALIVSTFFDRRYVLFLSGFLLPLVVPHFQIGIGVHWYKIVGPITVLLVLLTRNRGIGLARTRAGLFLWLLGYAALISAIWMVAEYSWLQRWRLALAMSMGGGLGQTLYKMPVQLGSFVGQVMCVFIVPLWARTERDARIAVVGFLAGSMTSAGAGLLSMALVGRGTLNSHVSRGLLEVGGEDVGRLGGLSGEPKRLGACLALVIAFAFATAVFGRGRRNQGVVVLAVTASFALFLTYSTSAWVACAAGVAVAVLMVAPRRRASRVRVLFTFLAVGVLVATSFAFVGAVIEQRVFERIFGQARTIAGMKDMYVLRAFSARPLDAIWGFGLGGSDLAVIPYVDWSHLQYKRTPTPSTTGMRLFGDLGVIGLVVLSSSILALSRHLSRRNDVAAAVFALMGYVVLMLSNTLSTPGYLFLLGALLVRAEVGAEVRRAPPRNHVVDLDGSEHVFSSNARPRLP